VVIIKVSKKLFFCLKMMIAHLYRRKMAECIFFAVFVVHLRNKNPIFVVV